jgi:hypothetical protein
MTMSECKCQGPATIEYDGPAPTELPVTLDFVKQQAGIDPSDDTFDVLLTEYIKSAASMVQDWIGKTLITTSYIANWNFDFPLCMRLRENPELTIDRIEYIPTGQETYSILDPDMYLAVTDKHITQIYPESVWPTADPVSDTVQAYYSAGFGPDETSIPAEIKLAIAMVATKALNQRGDCDGECGADLLRPATKLLRNYKEYRGLYV